MCLRNKPIKQTLKKIIESESIKVILMIALFIGGLLFVGYLIENHYKIRDEERFKLFQRATEDCYKRERSCDAIFENLYEDLFPEPADSNY